MQKESAKTDKQLLSAELVKAGAKFSGAACHCFLHEDKTPSGGVYRDNSGGYKYKCHSCGFSGDVFDVIAKRDSVTVADAIKQLCGQDTKHNGGDAQKVFTKEAITDYLKTLGNLETVYKYFDDKNEIAFYVARIKTADGKTIRPFMPKGDGFVFGLPAAPRPLYNLPDIKNADTVVICEGEKCAGCLKEYGIAAVTSVGGAKAARNSDWTPCAIKNNIAWPDNDTEGKGYADDVHGILTDMGARVSVINTADLDLADGEDCFDYIEQLKIIGKTKEQIQSELQKVINSAKSKGCADKLSEKFDKIISGELTTIKFPFRWTSFLSNALLPETVTILCGNVGASKSFMLLQWLIFWFTQNIKCVCYELEEDRNFHSQRALSQIAGNSNLTDFDYIKDNPEIAKQAISEHSDFINNFGRCIEACPESQLTQPQIAEWILAKAKAGNRIIALDPVTALAQPKESWLSDNAFLQNIKRTAVDYHCSIILISHPVKAVSMPDITQLAGGAAYARFAQTVLWLESHEPKHSSVETDCGTTDTEHNRTLHILKSRNGTGQGRKLAFSFRKEDLTLNEFGLITRVNK
jgi:hypothetical protein